MKEQIKKNIIYLIPFTLGIILSVIVVGATTYISGSNVGYSNSKLTSDNIQDAIDELYTLSKTKTKIKAWEYHETGTKRCISGEEDTCISTTCYKSGSTCETGTVIKYYVNDNLFHYFYVLRDNGTTITMQQRENTIRNIAWHAGENDNSKGPDNILPILEQTTSTWTNVNVLEYTPGSTALYQNANTGCTYSSGASGTYLTSCGTNTYTMSARKARARMITAFEVSSTGCLVYKDGSTYTNIVGNSINAYNEGSCPDYMHNYLYDSTSYGGSYNNNTTNEVGTYDYGYWTMSADSGHYTNAWRVNHGGNLGNNSTSHTINGARAVVEITKSNL